MWLCVFPKKCLKGKVENDLPHLCESYLIGKHLRWVKTILCLQKWFCLLFSRRFATIGLNCPLFLTQGGWVQDN